MTVSFTGRKVGIIGYVTPDTKELSDTGKVVFLDEVESLRKEVARLKRQNVEIMIAVGHSGYDVDLDIAKQVGYVQAITPAYGSLKTSSISG